MRRLNPVVTLTTALLTAVAAASPRPSPGQDGRRPAPTAPEAPSAIAPSDPMASARSPRHLLRNGQDYLRYGEYVRALTLFREAEARLGELSEAERRELREGIEAARQGMRSPEPGDDRDGPPVARRGPSRSRAGALPGAIALADPAPRADTGPIGSTDGVLLTGGRRDAPAPAEAIPPLPGPAPASAIEPPVPPEPIAIDPGVLPSVAQAPPAAPAEVPVPPIPPAAGPVPAAAPASPSPPDEPPGPSVFDSAGGRRPGELPPLPGVPEGPASPPAEPAPIRSTAALPALAPGPAADALPALPSDAVPPSTPGEMPPLPAGTEAGPVAWPSAAIGAVPADRFRNASPPAIPEALPALPPSAEELMELGSLGNAAPPPAEAGSRSAPSPAPAAEGGIAAPDSGPRSDASAGVRVLRGRDDGPYRDLLSPEQREEIMRIVRRQEEAERRGFEPAPLPGDASFPQYEEDETTGSSIELPRPPSPSEIRPIQSIPVSEDFVPLPPRRFAPSRKYWAAAATCHAPLYFQDPVLERYGQSVEQKLGPIGRFLSYPLDDPTQSRQRNQIAQPLFSAGLFAAQIATWPYKVLMDTPGEAEYDLGYYRPGDLVPPDLIYAPLTGVGPPLRGKHY